MSPLFRRSCAPRAVALAALVAAHATPTASAGGSCTNSQWTEAYCPERCYMEGDAAMVQCLGKSGDDCGMRMESTFRSGYGTHSMTIKAAPGPGVVTTFYLSDNGGLYDKTCTMPWVEVDFEIMGNQAGPTTKVWTNLFTGACDEHWAWITVPFDVSQGYHTYAFGITDGAVSWLVDGIVYRTFDIAAHPDVRQAAASTSFEEFVSVWGKSSSDSGEGIPEFRAGMGLLDANTNAFPLVSGFKRGSLASFARSHGFLQPMSSSGESSPTP